jgi:hypothetical protein
MSPHGPASPAVERRRLALHHLVRELVEPQHARPPIVARENEEDIPQARDDLELVVLLEVLFPVVVGLAGGHRQRLDERLRRVVLLFALGH